MESSKPGTCKKWNLDDATIWKVNPEAGHHACLGLRAKRRSRLRPSRVVRRGRAGRRRHDVPDRLSRSDAADARRTVDGRLHHRAVHDVVVAGRADLRARDWQGSVDRRRAVRGDSQDDGRHDGRIFSERHRARALRKSRARLSAARLVPGQRRMGGDGRARRGVPADAARDRARSRQIRNGKRLARNSNRSRESSSTLSCADGFQSAP